MNIKKRILSAFLALSLTTGISLPVANAYDFNYEADIVYEKAVVDMETIAVEIRQHFVNRETEFKINIPRTLLEDTSNLKKMISLAVKDTPESSPVEGDYLAWTTGKSSFGFSSSSASDYYVTTFNMSYRTTAEQEAELDKKVAEILDELNVYSASDYEKIKAVHDYVINNVTYNLNASDLRYSAYGAAVQGEAVCQGYSLLMYRLLSELGINVRIVPGTANGGGHAWNLVELYGKYYYIDATFDDGVINKYAYFLKGSEDFDSYNDYAKPHVFETSDLTSSLYADYTDGDFLARFDISPTAFDPSAPVTTTTTPKTTTTTPRTTTTTSKTMTTTSRTTTTTPRTTTTTPRTTTTTLKTTTIPVTTTITPSIPLEYDFGDVNGDGMIDAKDASRVLEAYSLLSVGQDSDFTDEQKNAADINSNGKIEASDASLILSYYAYISTGGVMLFDEYLLTLYN